MGNLINSDLIRGHIDTIILSILYSSDRYGYEILGEIESKSGGQYQIKQPTLYSCLKRLENQGFIYSYRGDDTESGGGRRKYYALTDMGKELFKKNQYDWEHSREIIDKLVSDNVRNQISNTPIASPVDDSCLVEQNYDEIDVLEPSIVDEVVDEIEVADDVLAVELDSSEIQIETLQDDVAEDRDCNVANLDDYYITESNSYVDIVTKSNQQYPPVSNDEHMSGDDNESLNDFDREQLYQEMLEEAFNDESEINNNDNQFSSYRTTFNEVDEHYGNNIGSVTQNNDVLNSPIDIKKSKFSSNATPPVTQKQSTNLNNNKEVDVLKREYQNIIKNLLIGNQVNYTDELRNVENNAEVVSSNIAHKHRKIDANFNKLEDSVRDMGDNITIRTYNSETEKEFKETYYYLPNRLMLFQFGILFLIMLMEVIIPFVLIKLVLSINSTADMYVLVIGAIFASIFPIFATIANFTNPTKRRRYNLDFNNTILFRVIIFCILLVIIIAINIVFKMDISNPLNYLMTLVVPALLSSNVVVSAIIFKALYKTKKFNI